MRNQREQTHILFRLWYKKKNYFKRIFRNILIIVFLLLRARITFYNTEPTKCIKSIQFAECFSSLFRSLFIFNNSTLIFSKFLCWIVDENKFYCCLLYLALASDASVASRIDDLLRLLLWLTILWQRAHHNKC